MDQDTSSSSKKQNPYDADIYTFILKNWLTWLQRLASSKSAWPEGWRTREEMMSQFKVENHLVVFSLTWGRSVFCSVQPSIVYMRPSHIMEGNLLYWEPAISMLISSKITLKETFRILSDHIARDHC